MAQSLANVLVHLVFSTKDRQRLIYPDTESHLHAYMAGTLSSVGCPVLQVGGIEDHIHMLFALSRTITLSKAVELVKANSSRWIKGRDRRVPGFRWQGGYGAFSVSESNYREVVRYIQSQREHHRRETFQEEFRRLLDQHGIPYDERYVWD